MTRILLAASVSALALAACSEEVETDAAVDTVETAATDTAMADLTAAETVDAQSLEDILAIESATDRREALIERGDAIQNALRARFETRMQPLQTELDEIVALIEEVENELLAGAFTEAAPIVDEARACEGGNPDGPDFTPPATAEDLPPSAANEIIGAAFLTAADAEACVYRLDSGLRLRVDVANPEGLSPEGGETVLVHYEGTLPDGTVFDSSYARGEPAAFPSDRLIRGWVEALSHMKTGESWTLIIPADLAYGERGAGADIGPNSTLRFKVELLGLPLRPQTLGEVDAGDDG